MSQGIDPSSSYPRSYQREHPSYDLENPQAVSRWKRDRFDSYTPNIGQNHDIPPASILPQQQSVAENEPSQISKSVLNSYSNSQHIRVIDGTSISSKSGPNARSSSKDNIGIKNKDDDEGDERQTKAKNSLSRLPEAVKDWIDEDYEVLHKRDASKLNALNFHGLDFFYVAHKTTRDEDRFYAMLAFLELNKIIDDRENLPTKRGEEVSWVFEKKGAKFFAMVLLAQEFGLIPRGAFLTFFQKEFSNLKKLRMRIDFRIKLLPLEQVNPNDVNFSVYRFIFIIDNVNSKN